MFSIEMELNIHYIVDMIIFITNRRESNDTRASIQFNRKFHHVDETEIQTRSILWAIRELSYT